MIAPWWDCLLVGDSVHYGQGVWPPPDTMMHLVLYPLVLQINLKIVLLRPFPAGNGRFRDVVFPLIVICDWMGSISPYA
jgi:hypothetical protein